jgi:cyclopropane-fatty-acyl-phospholipid synthase
VAPDDGGLAPLAPPGRRRDPAPLRRLQPLLRAGAGPLHDLQLGVFEDDTKTLEQAQAEKFDLVCRKLNLRPGQRFLDIGCGWGGMVSHAAREYGVRALGVTLSLEQAHWAKEAIDRQGLGDLVEVRHVDYRDVMETGFDAISSIGMMEHVGIRNYPSYFSFVRDRLEPGGRLLNHSITRSHNRPTQIGAFIDRYVFPDGELTGSGTIIGAAQDAGLEVQHSENLRPHYARTLAGWSRNLEASWEECVAEVGEGTARVWGIYMAGSRIAFERGELELHQVLATRSDDHGASGFPLRPDWRP